MELKPESDNSIDQQLHRNEYMRIETTQRQMNDFFFLKEGKDLMVAPGVSTFLSESEHLRK